MKIPSIVVLVLILFSCQDRPVQSLIKKDLATLDFINFDSLFLNCKLKPFSSLKELKEVFGEPDSIINPQESIIQDNDYSILTYGETQFYLFDSIHIIINCLALSSTYNKICYKTFAFDKSTDLDSFSTFFPRSYKNKDQITINGEDFTALRFYTSNRVTDSQWITLFSNKKLKYFQYYGADD
jgi:hypothetical protein